MPTSTIALGYTEAKLAAQYLVEFAQQVPLTRAPELNVEELTVPPECWGITERKRRVRNEGREELMLSRSRYVDLTQQVVGFLENSRLRCRWELVYPALNMSCVRSRDLADSVVSDRCCDRCE